jgi:hypothetical protein
MRGAFGAILLVGCNSILGIHDLPPDQTSPDGPPAACSEGCACGSDADCGSHMYCDTSEVVSTTCSCVAGYTDQGGCMWTGVVTDPGFMTTTAWTLGSGMSISPDYYDGSDMVDPGMALAQTSGQMGMPGTQTLSAEVSQSFVMPRLSRAEALAIELSARVTLNPIGVQASTELDVGARWSSNAFEMLGANPIEQSTFVRSQACLGEAQYAPETSSGSGEPQSLDLSALVTGNLPPTGFEIDFDHLEIVEPGANACPVPGTVTNGSAEGSDGWTFGAYGYDGADGVSAGYAAGVGVQGSRGVQLRLAERCDEAVATVPMSIAMPSGSAAVALSVYHKHSGATETLALSGESLVLSSDSGGVLDTYCVPAALQGSIAQLTAELVDASECGSALVETADLDDVVLATDPGCMIVDGVVDPSFESGYLLMNVSRDAGDTVAAIDDGSAPDGTHYLRLAIAATCDTAEWDAQVVTPAQAPGVGTALTFQYNAPSGKLYAKGSLVPTQGSGWQPSKVCLDAIAPGQTQSISFYVTDSPTLCGAAEAVSAGIDTLALVADPTCPAF